MKKPDTTGMTKEQTEWCDQAYRILSSTNEFQIVIAETVAVLNSDLRKVNTGGKDFKILKSDDKTFDRVVVLIKLQNDMKSLSLLPKEVTSASRNPFEEASKKVKNGVQTRRGN